MSELVTHDEIARELHDVAQAYDKAPETIRYHELRYLAAKDAYQDAFDEGYGGAEGTIAEREIAGRGAARIVRDSLNREQADLNWAKAESRRLEAKQSNLQARSKAIQGAYRGAGNA